MFYKRLIRKLAAFLPLLNSFAGVDIETPPLLISTLKWSYPENEKLSFVLSVKSVNANDEFTDEFFVDSSSAVINEGLATITLDATKYLHSLDTGKYSVQVIAEDEFGQTSDTSEPISIEVINEKEVQAKAFAYKEGTTTTNLFFVKPLTPSNK